MNFSQVSRSPFWALKSRPKEHKKDLILLTETFHSVCMDYSFSLLLRGYFKGWSSALFLFNEMVLELCMVN